MRGFTRVFAAAVLAGSLAGLYLILEPVLPHGGTVAVVDQEAAAAPVRPANVPSRIPPWAWELLDWELTVPALRPPRPSSAPSELPEWYADWRDWRTAVGAR